MFDYRYLITPIIGMIIGYITNALAIHMLFRPHNEVRIGRFRLPFTPGLIPKNRGRLASAIGDVVSRELLNPDVVRRTLLSDDMREKTGAFVDEVFEKWLLDDRSIEDMLRAGVGDKNFDKANAFAREKLSGVLGEKLKEADVGDVVAKSVMSSIGTKAPAPIHKMLSPVMTPKLREDIQKPLKDFINRYIEGSAHELMEELINKQFESMLNMPVSEAAQSGLEQKSRIKKAFTTGFEKLVGMGTERALAEIDIATMIERQIGDFDSREIERIVFSVMDRELKAIIWLGALLGFLMGLVNLLFL